MTPQIDTDRLLTVSNYADAYNGGKGVTRAYIYRLIREGKIETLVIDGVTFVVLPSPPDASAAG